MSLENTSPENETEHEHDLPPFKVFVSHGRNPLWKELAEFIGGELELDTAAFEGRNGEALSIELLDEAVGDSAYAIVVLTTEDNTARESAALEVGFLQGLLGPNNVLVLRQEGVKEFAGISDMAYLSFTGSDIKSSFEKVGEELEGAVEDYDSCDDCADGE